MKSSPVKQRGYAISSEELNSNPEWADLKATLEFLEKQPPEFFYTSKYYKAHQIIAGELMVEWLEENPDLTFREVMPKLLDILPNCIPDDELEDFLKYCLEIWQKEKAQVLA